MKYNNNMDTKEKLNLHVAEDNDFMENIDYDDMLRGIEASRNDFKHGKYTNIKTSMEITRRMLFGK